MCDLCRADENYFHTTEYVYGQLVSEYPVTRLRDSTLNGASYTLREQLSPEGMGLAIQNYLLMNGVRLRMRYNEAIDEEINPQQDGVKSINAKIFATVPKKSSGTVAGRVVFKRLALLWE